MSVQCQWATQSMRLLPLPEGTETLVTFSRSRAPPHTQPQGRLRPALGKAPPSTGGGPAQLPGRLRPARERLCPVREGSLESEGTWAPGGNRSRSPGTHTTGPCLLGGFLIRAIWPEVAGTLIGPQRPISPSVRRTLWVLRSSEEQTAGRASLTRLRCSTSPFSRAHTEAFSGGSRDCAVTSRQASDGASGVHTPETPSDLLSVQSGSHQGPNLANDDPGVPGAPGSTPPESLLRPCSYRLVPESRAEGPGSDGPRVGSGSWHGVLSGRQSSP